MAENVLNNCLSGTNRPAKRKKNSINNRKPLHLMLLVPVILTLIFSYGSMAGILLAFQNYRPMQGFYVFGSKFVGLDNFIQLFQAPKFWEVLRNTVFISLLKIIAGTAIPIMIAIFMNEISKTWFKRGVQTIIFLPHFISWVILAGVFVKMFAADGGVMTVMLSKVGIAMPDYFGNPSSFPVMIILSSLWKDAGYGAIVYIAAITMINPSLHEAAKIDGAGHIKSTIHITLPGMLPVIILMTVLNMGNILNAGFEQIFNLYQESVYSVGDILDTYIFRLYRQAGASGYSLGTAVGLFKSVVSLIFISTAYIVASKAFDYKIF